MCITEACPYLHFPILQLLLMHAATLEGALVSGRRAAEALLAGK